MAQKKKAKKKKPAKTAKKPIEAKTKKKIEKTEINFIYLTLFVIGMFALILFGARLLSKPKVVSIDDLHKQNLEGKLDPDKGYVYKGYSFVFANGLWFTKVKSLNENKVFNIQLHYGPRESENITVDGDIMQFREFNGTYLTFDPLGADLGHTGVAGSELSINLATFFNMAVVSACTKNETQVCHIRDIVTCENNDQNPIIYIEEAKDARIVQDSNCIRIQGNGFDLVRAVDKLLYAWMGILN